MNSLSGIRLDRGVRALIGKGGMEQSCRTVRGRGVYLAFTEDVPRLRRQGWHLRGVFFEELGMAEAVWIINSIELPLVVGIDAHGGDIFAGYRGKQQYNSTNS